ncbi:MAG: c-type cytochrome domain-containing protein, partial [Akkermansiaceae bacterium]
MRFLTLTVYARAIAAISPLVATPLCAQDFSSDAVPVLKKYCYECHGGEKQEAGIDFRSLLTTDQA